MPLPISGFIAIGGVLTHAAYAELADIIASEGLLLTEWDGDIFQASDRTVGEPLHLYAKELQLGYLGHFERLQYWCIEKKVPFVMWSAGYDRLLDPTRVIFRGTGNPEAYKADIKNRIVIDRDTVESLGSMEAVLSFFDAADFSVPPLVIEETDKAPIK